MIVEFLVGYQRLIEIVHQRAGMQVERLYRFSADCADDHVLAVKYAAFHGEPCYGGKFRLMTVE